jgi:hypothetical protein
MLAAVGGMRHFTAGATLSTIRGRMAFDFTLLGGEQFERLCAALLSAEGFGNIRFVGTFGVPDQGIDLFAESPEGERCIVQTKALRRVLTSPSLLQRMLLDLARGLEATGATRAILILSVTVSQAALAIKFPSDRFHIWDAAKLAEVLERHPHVRLAFWDFIQSGDVLNSLLSSIASPAKSPTAEQLISRLRALPAGRSGWRDYESICIDMLNYALIPPLRLPKVQSRTHDGLDRRDAIYPIGTGNAFWESIKYQHDSRMVVAEFKNHSGPVGQSEVESLQQYLLPKAKRSFGLLCSREQPAESALRARRRAWMVADNIILFLSDGDLIQMVRTRAANEDPSDILDAQMDSFFITLSP